MKKNKRFKLGFGYPENNPQLQISYKPYCRTVKDELVKRFVESVDLPNGHQSKCPIDVPRGIFVLKEMFTYDYDDVSHGEECCSEGKYIPDEEKILTYTLVPLNESHSLLGDSIKIKSWETPTIEQSFQQLNALMKLLNFKKGKQYLKIIENALIKTDETEDHDSCKQNTSYGIDETHIKVEVPRNSGIFNLNGNVGNDLHKLNQMVNTPNSENLKNN